PETNLSVADDEELRELIVGYQRGDSGAAEQLVRRISPMLFRFLANLGSSRSGAEDLLQECWLRIHKARHTYSPDYPVLPWIFAIARHTRLDAYRRSQRLQRREMSIEEVPDSHRAVEQLPETSDVLRQLGCLPKSQREVVV